MSTPAIIYIVFISIELLYSAHTHGKPKMHQTDNFWPCFIAAALLTGLLLWGGFFN